MRPRLSTEWSSSRRDIRRDRRRPPPSKRRAVAPGVFRRVGARARGCHRRLLARPAASPAPRVGGTRPCRRIAVCGRRRYVRRFPSPCWGGVLGSCEDARGPCGARRRRRACPSHGTRPRRHGPCQERCSTDRRTTRCCRDRRDAIRTTTRGGSVARRREGGPESCLPPAASGPGIHA